MERARLRRRTEHGSVIVEFAVIGILLLVLISFLIQSSIVLHAWLTATNAAREAARAGSPCLMRSIEPCTTAQVANHAATFMLNFPLAQAPTATLSTATTPKGKEAYVTVTVVAKVPLIAPGLEPVFADGMNVIGRSKMRLENPPPP